MIFEIINTDMKLHDLTITETSQSGDQDVIVSKILTDTAWDYVNATTARNSDPGDLVYGECWDFAEAGVEALAAAGIEAKISDTDEYFDIEPGSINDYHAWIVVPLTGKVYDGMNLSGASNPYGLPHVSQIGKQVSAMNDG